jgi:hypothetical protein
MQIKFISTSIGFMVILISISCSDSKLTEKKDRAPSKNKSISISTNAPVPKSVAESKFDGPYLERYESGIIYKTGQLRSGMAEGIWRVFYRNGKLWSEGQFQNGIRQGHAVTYDEKGNKTSEGEYKDGKAIGKWIYWSNGMVKEFDWGTEPGK